LGALGWAFSVSRSASIETFMPCRVDRVIFWTSSPWIVMAIMRLFCSSQN